MNVPGFFLLYQCETYLLMVLIHNVIYKTYKKNCLENIHVNVLRCENCWQASHYVHDGIRVISFKQCWISRKVDYSSNGSIVFAFFPIHDYLYIKVLHVL